MAFENDDAPGYVTEKLGLAFLAGAVPIYWGPSTDHIFSNDSYIRCDDLEECAVHTLSHECFHFLSDFEQVDLANSEANANWWGDKWLDAYRETFDKGGQLRLF